MFKIKLYKYDSTKENNGYRGEDLSKYVMQGNEFTEDITQVMDTTEITLTGLPQRESFSPEAKFIADIYQFNEKNEIMVDNGTRHLCVSQDLVSKPILSDDNYFDHHISFIEPSVVAEKRLVDNIAVTYKLKDVSLEETPAFPDTTALWKTQSSIYVPEKNFGAYKEKISGVDHNFTVWGKYFQTEGEPYMLTATGERKNKSHLDIRDFEVDGSYSARFEVPKLAIYAGVAGGKTFAKIGYASIDYVINEYEINGYNPTNSWKGSFISNSSLVDNVVGAVSEYNNEWLLEKTTKQKSPFGTYADILYYYYKKYSDRTAQTPTYITQQIPILPDKRYSVSISLHQFEDNLPTRDYPSSSSVTIFYKYTDGQPTDYAYSDMYTYWLDIDTQTIAYTTRARQMTSAETTGSVSYNTYSVDTQKIVYASSTPYSALALLQKAIINSAIYEKKDGVYIADVNKSKLPFYVDDDYVDELSATVIVENFYNQKNLWQVMTEVGNYIHAIPEIKFGSDDRFVITFNKLGNTQEYTDKGNKVSIFNSRSVEDYISATSSYATNMVQLGGYLEEWLAPKTTDEQLLVYNDTAELVLTKPIIELLQVKVRRNSDGEIADMTDYIYEENVYKTLSLQYNVNPNRGIAMYYSLGTNVITGGQYQLPQENTNEYSDYAFKKIIYSAFYGYNITGDKDWSKIDVKDYTFYVRYRTKDSVRQNHVRPDLRKYLLNTQYDRYPEHNQFNNQQDVVVDSIKFGNNMFGKLIRTGNNSYEVTEWHDKYEDIKHKGELYRINEELYYVATVTHYIFSGYILSKVKYSKDYNELSNIIGIPSEPRFYEISEQSLIRRDLAINDLILLTDDETQVSDSNVYNSNYMRDYDHLADLILGEGTEFAKYAITVFKGDKDAVTYDQTVGEKDTYIEVMTPLNAYSSENTLTYEWDMLDNYSAGDQVVNTEKKAYKSLKAVGYTDIFGKAALMDFYILENINTEPTAEEINAFPVSPISTTPSTNWVGFYDILASNVPYYDDNLNGRGIGLLKDCREAISINYNLQMVVNSDTFVLSPYVYLPDKENLKIVLLADEVNKLSTGYIDNSVIITPLDKHGNIMNPYFDFTVTKKRVLSQWNPEKQPASQFSLALSNVLANVNDGHFDSNADFQQIKAIAVLCDVPLDASTNTNTPVLPYKTQFVVARNIPSYWDRTKALATWYWGAPVKAQVFKNKQ